MEYYRVRSGNDTYHEVETISERTYVFLLKWGIPLRKRLKVKHKQLVNSCKVMYILHTHMHIDTLIHNKLFIKARVGHT